MTQSTQKILSASVNLVESAGEVILLAFAKYLIVIKIVRADTQGSVEWKKIANFTSKEFVHTSMYLIPMMMLIILKKK